MRRVGANRLLWALIPMMTVDLAGGAFAAPGGFSEPPLVLYGKVVNTAGGGSAQIFAGTAQWTIQPPVGPAFTIPCTLENLGNGAFSYKVEIPAEKVPSSAYVLSSETIPASAAAQTYTLSATVEGQAATLILPNLSPHPGDTSYQEILRGKTERIDLNFTGDADDTDGDGLPDWWEILYAPATNKDNPNDPLTDPDGDGAPTLTEYFEGTDPTCHEYAKWLGLYSLDNAPNLNGPNDDPDLDGIKNIMEYALGGDPRTPDAALIRSNVILTLEASGNQKFLSLTANHPAGRHCNADYFVEASDDLSIWSSAEGTQVNTLLSSSSILQVRDAKMISPANGQRFLRLRIQAKP